MILSPPFCCRRAAAAACFSDFVAAPACLSAFSSAGSIFFTKGTLFEIDAKLPSGACGRAILVRAAFEGKASNATSVTGDLRYVAGFVTPEGPVCGAFESAVSAPNCKSADLPVVQCGQLLMDNIK